MSSSKHKSHALCRALADPMRVRILNLLRSRREIFASELATILGLHRNDLNWHIKLLERAHLIGCRRIGVQRQYRFREELTPFHQQLLDFLASVEHLLEENSSE